MFKKLENLSPVSKVCYELKMHLRFADKVLVEAVDSRTEAELANLQIKEGIHSGCA